MDQEIVVGISLQGLIILLVIGGVAGWLAGVITKSSFGVLGNIIIGVIGAFIGSYLFAFLGIHGGGLVWDLIAAVVGALIFLFVLGLFSSKRTR